jgi:hypothetical protein
VNHLPGRSKALALFSGTILTGIALVRLISTLEWFAVEMSKTYRIRIRHDGGKVAPWTVEVFKGWYCIEVSHAWTKNGAIRKGRRSLKAVHAPSWQIEEKR